VKSAGGFIGANEDRAFAMTAPKRKWEKRSQSIFVRLLPRYRTGLNQGAVAVA